MSQSKISEIKKFMSNYSKCICKIKSNGGYIEILAELIISSRTGIRLRMSFIPSIGDSINIIHDSGIRKSQSISEKGGYIVYAVKNIDSNDLFSCEVMCRPI